MDTSFAVASESIALTWNQESSGDSEDSGRVQTN